MGSIKTYVELNANTNLGNGSTTLSNLNLNAVDYDSTMSASLKLDKIKAVNVKSEETGETETINITDISAVVYIDESDENNSYKNALLDLANVNVEGADYKIDMVAKDQQGNDTKIKVFVLEDGQGKYLKVFSEDGSLIYTTGEENGKDLPEMSFKSWEYFETDEFKQFVGDTLKYKFKKNDENKNLLQEFSIARVDGFETLDDSLKAYEMYQGQILEQNYKENRDSTFTFERLNITDQNTLDLQEIYGSVENGSLNIIEYKDDGETVKTQNTLNIGSAFGRQIKNGNGSEITVLKANDIDLLVLNKQDMNKLSGSIGNVFYSDNPNIQTIAVEDIESFSYENLKTGALSSINAKKLVRVVENDDKREVTSEFLLVNKALFEHTDKENDLEAKIRVGVLEVLQDKLNDKNIILKADLDGRIKLTKGLYGAEASFALKGQNIEFDSDSSNSDDGSYSSRSFSINTSGENGRLDLVDLKIGPNFKKDFLSISAKGSESGGRSINLSYAQDKKSGKLYIKGEFKDGEKLEVKLFPFKWKAGKNKDGVAFEQVITPKGQNLMTHLDIVGNTINLQEITSWLKVSPEGMIVMRTPLNKGRGIEFIYKDEETLVIPDANDIHRGEDAAKSIGLGIIDVDENGNETSKGILLSGDAEFDIYTSQGTFEIAGIEMDKHSRVPAVVNMYWKKRYQDGDGVYLGVFYDTTSSFADTNYLDPNAEYFNNGRSVGEMGGSFAYHKKLTESARVTFGMAANQNFKNKQFCVQYESNSIEPLTELGQGLINILSGRDFDFGPKQMMPKMRRLTAMEQAEAEMLKTQIAEISKEYLDIRFLQKMNELVEVLNQAEKGNRDLTDEEIKSLDIGIEEIKRFDNIALGVKTQLKAKSVLQQLNDLKVFTDPNLSDEQKVRYKVSTLRGSLLGLSDHYKSSNSIRVYTIYLDKYRALQDLGVYITPIQKN